MKIHKSRVVICFLVLLLFIGTMVFVIIKNSAKNQPEDVNIVYEKVNMITSLRFGISEFDHINPHVSQNKDVLQIDSLVFEPLLQITEDYHIQTCLAKEWSKVSEKAYIIKLKENAKWQDGMNFTAEDVKYTIETIQKEKKSIYLENVKSIEKIEVIDNYTIRFELKETIPFFEYQLIFPIISKKQYEKKSLDSETIIPYGTGKYKITKMSEDKIELSKDENWREIEKENANIKTITISLFENMGEVYNAFRLANIDFIHTNNVNYEEYIGSLGYQKKQYPGREYDYIAFNCQNAVLQFSEIRQALSKIIDTEKILTTVLQNKALKANFPLDYGNYLIQDMDLNHVTNIEDATKLLQKSGWKYEYGIWSKEIEGITKTLNFELSVNQENETRVKVAEEIKQQLENVGINVTIRKLSTTNYQKILENHQYEMILTGIYNSYSPNLSSFFDEKNLANYENEELREILHEINNITQEDLLKEKYKKIVEIWKSDVPYLGLYRNQSTVAYGQDVLGDVAPNNYSVFYHFAGWYRQ